MLDNSGILVGQPKLAPPYVHTMPDGAKVGFAQVVAVMVSPEVIQALVANIVPAVVGAMVGELQRRGALAVTKEDSEAAWRQYESLAPDEEKACPQCAAVGKLVPDVTFQFWDWLCENDHRWLSRASIVRDQAQEVKAGTEAPDAAAAE